MSLMMGTRSKLTSEPKDGVLIPDGFNGEYDEPSWRIRPLERRLGRVANWDLLVFLENCAPHLIDSPYDQFREVFMGSRGFVMSSGFCGLADAAVQEGDLMIRVMGMQTLMIARPSENGTFRLISPVDVEYHNLLPEIEEMWKDEGEWIPIS
jgi:hypothetical protein